MYFAETFGATAARTFGFAAVIRSTATRSKFFKCGKYSSAESGSFNFYAVFNCLFLKQNVF